MKSATYPAIVVASIASALFSGCASVGSFTPPVSREIQIGASFQARDKAYACAVRALADNGTLNAHDRGEGLVTGVTRYAVTIVVHLDKSGIARVKGQLPSDKFIVGTSVGKEVDGFVAAFNACNK